MGKDLAFFFVLLKTSLRASISLRGAFLLEVFLMIGNNLLFFALWWIFFHHFEHIGGWTIQEMRLLTAIGTGGYGLMQIVFGGVRNLSKMILEGELDPFMTQPKNLLIHIISSRSYAKGWGHLLTSLVLIPMGGPIAPTSLILVIVSILSGSLVFTACGIIARSLVFWLGPVESVAQKYCESLFLFSLYPTNIYTGFLKGLLFTIIPAGIIGYLPVELIRSFSYLKLLLLIGSSLALFALAFFVFYRGLRRYESGSRLIPRG